MSSGINIPYFPHPSPQYDQRQMAQLVQAFALFAKQIQNAGPWRATELTLTALQSDDAGLAVGALFQQNGFVKVTISNVPHPRGVAATAGVGAVTVSTP